MRALISVSDKTGILNFAQNLAELGCEIISTGGTAGHLRAAGLTVTDVSELTGFPECLDGRVKTLHPFLYAGILAKPDVPEHSSTLDSLGVIPIDLVVVNLYPFVQTIAAGTNSTDVCVEQIDIGGPALLRAAAKNHAYVTVLTDPVDYMPVLSELRSQGKTSLKLRRYLARKAYDQTAAYDAMIAQWFRRNENLESVDANKVELTEEVPVEFPEKLTITYERHDVLRYGENPHQTAALYREPLPPENSLVMAEQLAGKALSYNNYADTQAAIDLVQEFLQPAVVAVKHANPCGVGIGEDIFTAWYKAWQADQVSIFGGIVAANRTVTGEFAESAAAIFLEVIIAPDFEEEALNILTKRKNLRILRLSALDGRTNSGNTPRFVSPLYAYMIKDLRGGILLQQRDTALLTDTDIRVVTDLTPPPELLPDIYFGMTVVKHVRSNAIVVVKNGQTLGIGPGQPNRITSVELALKQAGAEAAGAVLASDAFFPFDDSVRAAAAAGIATIVQPGGSLKDQDSILACNELGVSMIFTGRRHFRH